MEPRWGIPSAVYRADKEKSSKAHLKPNLTPETQNPNRKAQTSSFSNGLGRPMDSYRCLARSRSLDLSCQWGELLQDSGVQNTSEIAGSSWLGLQCLDLKL